jgi:Zn-finger nucleic acid-binding protein
VNWQAGDVARATPLPVGYAPTLADDSGRRALLCPESGRILLRYRVGHNLSFHIERSPVTGGVWLDKGEWEALKSVGLHSQMHLIFTAHYQARIRSEDLDHLLEKTFRERIGADDFLKIQEIRRWINHHEKKRELLCYLMENLHKPTEPTTASRRL